MVDGIRGNSGPLAREAILAAMKAHAKAADGVRSNAAETASGIAQGPRSKEAAASGGPSFAEAIKSGIAEVNAEVQKAEALPEQLVMGEVEDISEVAARLKTADLTFRFSMEIRNKLLDAYREVMRMQV